MSFEFFDDKNQFFVILFKQACAMMHSIARH
ncbi:not available [Yersinia enterocolitica]|nr:not available [Yersinia enterocolitica]